MPIIMLSSRYHPAIHPAIHPATIMLPSRYHCSIIMTGDLSKKTSARRRSIAAGETPGTPLTGSSPAAAGALYFEPKGEGEDLKGTNEPAAEKPSRKGSTVDENAAALGLSTEQMQALIQQGMSGTASEPTKPTVATTDTAVQTDDVYHHARHHMDHDSSHTQHHQPHDSSRRAEANLAPDDPTAGNKRAPPNDVSAMPAPPPPTGTPRPPGTRSAAGELSTLGAEALSGRPQELPRNGSKDRQEA